MIDLLRETRIQPSKARRMDSQGEVLSGLAALALMVALILIAHLGVKYIFGASYLGLYLKYGYMLIAAFTFVALVVDLDQYRGLISAHPFHYLSDCLRLVRGPLQATGADSRREADQHAAHHEPAAHHAAAALDASVWAIPAQLAVSLMNAFDLFISGFFSIVFILALSAWLLFAAPLQYFLFLLCGAPARVIERSRKRSQPALHKAETDILDVPGVEPEEAGGLVREVEAGASFRPVRLTSALALLVLWAWAKVMY